MGFFITILVVVGAVFAFLAWRMDRKHPTSAVLDRHTGSFDKEVSNAMMTSSKNWENR